jgi:hypothetical protein
MAATISADGSRLYCGSFGGILGTALAKVEVCRSQKPNYFRDDEQQLLFMKSRYMAPDQEGYERQKTFDDALEKLHLFDFDLSQFGPPTGVFTATLASAGYSINGFTIASRSP